VSAILQTSSKKLRKPQSRSLPLRQAILDVAGEYERLTVRQLFYQLVTRQVVEKTEGAYHRAADFCAQLRLDGSLRYEKIADSHRTRHVPWTFTDMRDAWMYFRDMYRKSYWSDQPRQVEVWCEKDALSGVIEPVCDEYGVVYVATRGFPSLTLLHESAKAMSPDQETHVFYFGDHDASGRAISANIAKRLREWNPRIIFRRVALEPDQIEDFGLPTRPGKASDSRHRDFADRFGSASVELDALPPDELASMVRGVIESCIDHTAWDRAKRTEKLEEQTLAALSFDSIEPGERYGLHRRKANGRG
jgi:hypothetical protein